MRGEALALPVYARARVCVCVCVCTLQFKDRSTANNVEIILPIAGDAISPVVKTAVGTAV